MVRTTAKKTKKKVERRIGLTKRRAKVTLKILNETDNPKVLGGTRLGDDGENELWLFGNKVANRFCANDPDIEGAEDVIWSDDIAGWNYNPTKDAIPKS